VVEVVFLCEFDKINKKKRKIVEMFARMLCCGGGGGGCGEELFKIRSYFEH